jgi:hypothetical protein
LVPYPPFSLLFDRFIRTPHSKLDRVIFSLLLAVELGTLACPVKRTTAADIIRPEHLDSRRGSASNCSLRKPASCNYGCFSGAIMGTGEMSLLHGTYADR